MSSNQELILKKEKYMHEMMERLSNWGETMDQAIGILEENKQTIDGMQEADQDLTIEQLNEYNELHAETWQEIITMQQKLVEFVQTRKNKVEEQLVQMGQKEKVISSYISLQNKSIFVEKDY